MTRWLPSSWRTTCPTRRWSCQRFWPEQRCAACGARPGTTTWRRGVYVGLVGARFERRGRMEWRHMILTPEQNTSDNGYGAGSSDTMLQRQRTERVRPRRRPSATWSAWAWECGRSMRCRCRSRSTLMPRPLPCWSCRTWVSCTSRGSGV
mmetsp:Transcript_47821/g.132883  ORF Transcript_47821/g.132883 Transcript_47821/m.132883 type:complete len:150 (-) Transcript_47821:500-949(-)